MPWWRLVSKRNVSGGLILEFIAMETKLMYVQTGNRNQRNLLESQYLANQDYFVVPRNQIETVESIVRALSFQYFQNSTSPVADKMEQFSLRALGGTFSLTLLREIMLLVSQQEQSLAKFNQYFQDMNQQLTEDGEEDKQEETLRFQPGQNPEEDYLFQLADRGEIRATRLLEQLDLGEQIDQQCMKLTLGKAVTIKTQSTQDGLSTSEQNRRGQSRIHSNNVLNVLYSAQEPGTNQWWKKQNRISEQSKEISRFNRRGGKVIHQKSITQMLLEEMKRDLNREIELGKHTGEGRNKLRDEEGLFRFNKMVKGKLAQAKLKKRARR